ncbi:Apoptogenic protein 1, mitochondrial [Merluccius polli]|uniref:Apoptogenic protein 1, mitochondrial n=1 Tax=Merluccius polli TaxID=89951 RepID=A0AA47MP82_MERPO|nr:Apoptogenic protein 1, mitochondrial [Merluccius polli]
MNTTDEDDPLFARYYNTDMTTVTRGSATPWVAAGTAISRAKGPKISRDPGRVELDYHHRCVVLSTPKTLAHMLEEVRFPSATGETRPEQRHVSYGGSGGADLRVTCGQVTREHTWVVAARPTHTQLGRTSLQSCELQRNGCTGDGGNEVKTRTLLWERNRDKDPRRPSDGCSCVSSCVQSSAFKPAADSTHDWIGPPNKLSNIRPITYHVPPEETALERRLRMLRQQTETWNHEFWAHQNVTFSKEKEEFISSQLKAKGMAARDEQGRKHTLNSEEMAVFYKSFLDTNRTRHANYNKEWYRRNFTITLLMGRVVLTKAWKTITNVRKTSSSPT